MIVVIGSPVGRSHHGAMAAGGPASRVALAAARAGRSVQLVGKTGDDAMADEVLLDLTRGGVGHVALLRDPSRRTPLERSPADDDEVMGPLDAAELGPVSPAASATERETTAEPAEPALDAADVELGLRYLTDFAVIVLAESADSETVAIVAEAARWGGAGLVVVVAAGAPAPDGLPPDAIVFEAPDADPDGVFATLVGTFAAALDDGSDPGDAFRASVTTVGWTGSAAD